jgi:hypothetical protein
LTGAAGGRDSQGLILMDAVPGSRHIPVAWFFWNYGNSLDSIKYYKKRIDILFMK